MTDETHSHPIRLDAFSFGGGVQSTAALVLATQGKIDCKLFVFANVGEDSENPDTLAYVERYAKPLAAQAGIEFVEVSRKESILQAINSEKKSIIIPARLSQTGMPADRRCTVDWKIRRVDAYLRKLGYSKKNKAFIGIGFSMDEYSRMKTDRPDSMRYMKYPLIDMRLTRNDCRKIIEGADLPVPPKSSCFFCPFHSPAVWARLRSERPDLYKISVEIEKRINYKRNRDGHDDVFMHRYMVPLDVLGNQMMLDLPDDEDYECASGVCFV